LSRLPSGRGSAAAGSSRSAPAARRPGGVLVQSPKSDVYVAMLGIALAAIVISCILMAMLFGKYGFSTKAVASTAPPAPHTALA
jgi:hypothetical protein